MGSTPDDCIDSSDGRTGPSPDDARARSAVDGAAEGGPPNAWGDSSPATEPPRVRVRPRIGPGAASESDRVRIESSADETSFTSAASRILIFSLKSGRNPSSPSPSSPSPSAPSSPSASDPGKRDRVESFLWSWYSSSEQPSPPWSCVEPLRALPSSDSFATTPIGTTPCAFAHWRTQSARRSRDAPLSANSSHGAPPRVATVKRRSSSGERVRVTPLTKSSFSSVLLVAPRFTRSFTLSLATSSPRASFAAAVRTEKLTSPFLCSFPISERCASVAATAVAVSTVTLLPPYSPTHSQRSLHPKSSAVSVYRNPIAPSTADATPDAVTRCHVAVGVPTKVPSAVSVSPTTAAPIIFRSFTYSTPSSSDMSGSTTGTDRAGDLPNDRLLRIGIPLCVTARARPTDAGATGGVAATVSKDAAKPTGRGAESGAGAAITAGASAAPSAVERRRPRRVGDGLLATLLGQLAALLVVSVRGRAGAGAAALAGAGAAAGAAAGRRRRAACGNGSTPARARRQQRRRPPARRPI